MCVNVLCLLSIHTTLQWLLFVFSNCAIDFVHAALCVVFIRTWTVCSHFMLGHTFYVTFIPVTVCECHIELKATWRDKSRINALFRKAHKHGLCHTSLEIDELIVTAENNVYIIFFHRNATSALLPPSEPEAITLPSRTDFSLYKNSFINRCLFQFL